MNVRRWSEHEDGPVSEEALVDQLEELGFRVSRYVYSPGTRFPPHTHPVTKIDAVVSGRFRIEMGGSEVILEAGDWVEIPRGQEHAAEVVGDEPVVSLDAVAG